MGVNEAKGLTAILEKPGPPLRAHNSTKPCHLEVRQPGWLCLAAAHVFDVVSASINQAPACAQPSSDFTTLQDEGEWPVARDTGRPCPWLGAQWLQADGSEEDSMGDYQGSAQGCPSGKHGDSWVVSKEFVSAQSWRVLGELGTLRSCGQGEDEPKTDANSCGVSLVKVR